MIPLLVVVAIVGLLLFLTGMMMDFRRDGLDFFLIVAGLVMALGGFFGSVGVADHRSDVNRCEKVIPQTSGKETKWLDGECYVKANDGKFIPLEWLEEGYDD